jgi:hypothetical protein
MNVGHECSKDGTEMQRAGCRGRKPTTIRGQGPRRLFVFREARRVFL